MHQTSEQPEFMKTVKDIKEAEESYDRLIVSAKEKADKILQEAKERAIQERTKTEEEIVAFKNDHIRNGSKGIESEVEKILQKSGEDAEDNSKKKVDSPVVSKLLKDFLNNL